MEKRKQHITLLYIVWHSYRIALAVTVTHTHTQSQKLHFEYISKAVMELVQCKVLIIIHKSGLQQPNKYAHLEFQSVSENLGEQHKNNLNS